MSSWTPPPPPPPCSLQLHSCQEMLSTQLHNAVIELLSKFLSEDFSKLERLKEAYDVAWQGGRVRGGRGEGERRGRIVTSPGKVGGWGGGRGGRGLYIVLRLIDDIG